MMYNTTHKNNEITELINTKVGKPFRIMERIKLKGIGSKRMKVVAASFHLIKYLNKVSDINYLNIELRPKGVILHLTKGHQNFAWPIPYYQLVFFKGDEFSLHANGNFIRVACDRNFKENKKFLKKLQLMKDNFNNYNNVSI